MSGAKLVTGVVAAMAMGGLITAAALNGPAAGTTAATPTTDTAPQTIDPRWIHLQFSDQLDSRYYRALIKLRDGNRYQLSRLLRPGSD